MEGNIIKNIFGISKRCKTTELLSALKIEQTYVRLNILKCEFYERLKLNPFTKSIINYLELIETEGSFINELDRIKNIIEDQLPVELKREDLSSGYKYLAKVESRSISNDNPRVAQIQKIFKYKNSGEISKQLYEILKFKIL